MHPPRISRRGLGGNGFYLLPGWGPSPERSVYGGGEYSAFPGRNRRGSGQTNHLTVTKSEEAVDDPGSPFGSSKVTYTLDDAVTITFDSDRCTYPTSTDPTLVACTWIVEDGPDPASIGSFTLADKNDTVTFVNPSQDTYSPDEFNLGSGNDTYTSTKYLDGSTIVGGTGNDTITVDRLGGDLSRLVGNNDNDKLYGGQGKDKLSGGPGRDVIKQD